MFYIDVKNKLKFIALLHLVQKVEIMNVTQGNIQDSTQIFHNAISLETWNVNKW